METLKCAECGGSGKVPCSSCSGSGHVNVTCHVCNGSKKEYAKCLSCTDGFVIDPDDDRKVKCPKCHGSGRIETGACKNCGGSGKEIVNCPECSGRGNVTCAICGGSGVANAQMILNDAKIFNRQTGDFFEEACDSRYPCEDDQVWWFDVLKDAAIAGDADAAWACLHAVEAWDSVDDTEENANLTEKLEEIALDTVFAKNEKFCEAKEKLRSGDPESISLLKQIAKREFPPAYALLAMITHVGLLGVQRDDGEAIDYCRKCIGVKFPLEIPTLTKGYLLRLESFVKALPVAAQNDVPAMLTIANALDRLRLPTDGNIVDSVVSEWCQKIVAHSSPDDLNKGGKIRSELEKFAADSREAVTKVVMELLQGGKSKGNEPPLDPGVVVRKSAGSDSCNRPVNTKPTDETDVDGDDLTSISINPVKAKKRITFIILGLLLGWLGFHFVYAKRWVLFALHLSFIAMSVMFPACAVFVLITWLGGAFLVKKDGSGQRMT